MESGLALFEQLHRYRGIVKTYSTKIMTDTGTKAAWLFALIGIALLISAGFMFYSDSQLTVRGLTAQGTVIDFRQGRVYRKPTARQRDADPNNFSDFRAPVIRFTTEKNEVIQFAALLGSFPDGLNKGDTIPVLYLAEDPRGAEVKAHRGSVPAYGCLRSSAAPVCCHYSASSSRPV